MIVASPCAEKWEVKPMFYGHAPLSWFRIRREVAPVVKPVIEPARRVEVNTVVWSPVRTAAKPVAIPEVKFAPIKPVKRIRKGAAKAAFLRSPEWRNTRDAIFARDGRVCKHCRSTSNLQIDHIMPMSAAPELSLDLDNLQVLCWPCNKVKGARIPS